ncbi:MAG: M20 family metallo-hydrolase, partial [Calditrichaeota bacterium]
MNWTSEFETVCRRLQALEPEMVAFQKELTAIPALGPENGGQGEWERAQFLRKKLEAFGVPQIEQIDAPDSRVASGKRPNLIARVPGKSSQKTIWILTHMDVVPEGDRSLWDTDPWQAVVKEGKIYGRGTEDNQQSLTSALFTLKAFLDTGIKPAYPLALIFVADEETGSEYGLKYLLQHHRHLFSPNDIILVPDAGEPDSTMIEVAEKSILWLRFTTHGSQCHASLPDHGVNAFRAASHLVVALEQLYQRFNLRNELYEPPISTFEPTKKEANVGNVNTIPGKDVFYLDCRILPEYRISEVMDFIGTLCLEVEDRFKVKIEVEPVQVVEAPPPTPADAEVVERLKRAVKAVYNVEARPMGIGGGTVAAVFRQAGLPVAVWSTVDDVCHQPNEYAVIE